VVARHSDEQVKVHHPPRRSDSWGWTTVQSGRKHKGGRIVAGWGKARRQLSIYLSIYI